MNKTSILKVIVGSQAHGLATPESDFDYRGVFVVPTNDILKLGGKIKNTHWVEGEIDNTQWEIGHFLHMATKSNPTILETFLSPIEETTEVGKELRALFPHVWSAKGVMDAFIGYGLNQRKKFLNKKDDRPHKFAAAYLRSLFNGAELLTRGTFTIRIADTEVGDDVRRFKEGDYEVGEVIQICSEWEDRVRKAYELNTDKQPDLEKVNDFLLSVRKANFK